MRSLDRATRMAWCGAAVAGAAAAIALRWRRFALPALVADACVCAATVGLTTRRLQALAEQSRQHEHESLHDPVTELPNRILFDQQAQQALAALQRRSTSAAVIMLDLDRFKEVNDTLGHHQGDLLLHEVANRLRGSVRAGDLVARLGGDEFAVCAIDIESIDHALLLAERLQLSIAIPVELAGVAVDVEASLGMSIYPEQGLEIEQLVRQADIAMYQAKRQFSDIEIYNVEKDESSRGRLGLLAELRHAIGDGQIVVHYQPKVGSRSGRVQGVEALVRWQHPTLGLLYPDTFVGLAENTGLMRPLTSRVLDLALEQLRTWRDAGHDELTVAVNLSTRNLLDIEFPTEVAARLAAHGLPASALELEITETTMMVDPVRSKAVLADLAALGVGLAIDDFGTGYTSLAWLGELPVTTLKIDKSFVMRMTDHAKDEAIVRSSVQLGQNLGLKVVAEGIEHSEALAGLAALDCDYCQGYYFSRPQPAEVLDGWLSENRGDAEAA